MNGFLRLSMCLGLFAMSWVFTTAAPAQTPELQLTAEDGAITGSFGYSVALSADGNTALVGAATKFGGSAYVFVRSNEDWSQEQELGSGGGFGSGFFGMSVALSADGNIALVGAGNQFIEGNVRQGAAYVFVRSYGEWSQSQQLTASDGASNDSFGNAVALSADGNTLLVAAASDDVGGNFRQGSVYVFVRSDTGWSQQQQLTANDGQEAEIFGSSVTLSADGTTALVGAYSARVGNNPTQGSAYIFVRSDEGWRQQQKLTASDGADGDLFGSSVALSADGTIALIGADNDDIGGITGQGSAYVFVRSDESWRQQDQLTTDNVDGPFGSRFGNSVALSADGSSALVGAVSEDEGSIYQKGAAYIFARSDDDWIVRQRLTASDGEAFNRFGYAVTLSADGTTALVGAVDDEEFGKYGQGSAYAIAVGELVPIPTLSQWAQLLLFGLLLSVALAWLRRFN